MIMFDILIIFNHSEFNLCSLPCLHNGIYATIRLHWTVEKPKYNVYVPISRPVCEKDVNRWKILKFPIDMLINVIMVKHHISKFWASSFFTREIIQILLLEFPYKRSISIAPNFFLLYLKIVEYIHTCKSTWNF